VTGDVFQPFASGAGVRVAVIAGAVLSRRIVNVFVVSAFPATSTAENVIVLVPSALITTSAEDAFTVVVPTGCGPVTLYEIRLTPDAPSVDFKLTVTFELFQPAAFGSGKGVAVVTGATLSMLMPLTVADAELPAMSLHVRVTDWLAPSLDSVTGGGGLPAARPDPGATSVQVKVTVT